MILTISRGDVEAGNIAGVLAHLFQLTDSRDNVLRHQGAVTLQVDGYEEEAAELFEIPRLRSFLQVVTAEWPHWLWFLKRGSNSIPLLFSLLCQVRAVSGQEGFQAEFADGNELLEVLGDLLERSEVLYRCYGITEAQATLCAESAVWDLFDGVV